MEGPERGQGGAAAQPLAPEGGAEGEGGEERVRAQPRGQVLVPHMHGDLRVIGYMEKERG